MNKQKLKRPTIALLVKEGSDSKKKSGKISMKQLNSLLNKYKVISVSDLANKCKVVHQWSYKYLQKLVQSKVLVKKYMNGRTYYFRSK